MKSGFIIFFAFLVLPVLSLALDKINVNTATLQELDNLAGIGPVMAQRIIDARPFSSLDDLAKVKGIGEKTLQKIKEQGLAYASDHLSSSSLRGASQSDEAISNLDSQITGEIASPASPPRNDVTGVFFNEILPNPNGNDETDEYIKLYNSNNFEVDLTGWKITDTVGTISTFIIPQNTKILAQNYLVFKRPETKIMLNNDQDGLNLISPDGKIIDSVSFTKAPLGQSYKKISSGWQWSGQIAKILPKTEKSDNNDYIKPNLTAEEGLADISQIINQKQTQTNPWFLFFMALGSAIICAIIVLFIKLKFRNNKNLKI